MPLASPVPRAKVYAHMYCTTVVRQAAASFMRTHKRFSLSVQDEALGDAVALGLAHGGRRGLDAEEGDLALEVVGHIVRSVVVPEHEAGGHVLADGAEVPARALADRFQGLEAVGALVGVDADAFAVAVIDGDEDVGHALVAGRVIKLTCSRRWCAACVLHHGYETSGCIVHAAKSMTLCWSALT